MKPREMNNLKYPLFLFFAILSFVLLTSCSIQKRIYRLGYSLSWKKEKPTAVNRQNFYTHKYGGNSQATEDSLFSYASKLTAQQGKEPTIVNYHTVTLSKDLFISGQDLQKNQQIQIRGNIKVNHPQNNNFNRAPSSIDVIPKRKPSIFKVIFVLFLLLGLLISALGLLLTFASTFIYFFIGIILSFIFAILVINRIGTKPERYKGKGRVRAGLNFIILTLSLLLLVLALIYFSI